MCLIAFAWQAHDDYPLIVAGNRDEFFARPTASADWWPDGRVLGGRDLRAGGTWMGVSRDGRFAALTNHRDPSSQRPDAPSRGRLVGDFLAGEAALENIAREAGRFNGFNLLAARWRSDTLPPAMWIVSNAGSPGPKPVAPGVHGLSNARLDTHWPKVDYAIAATHDAMRAAATPDALVERLFTILDDRTIAADADLPETGVPLETERALSAVFIRMQGYGTRASTVLLVDREGHATFVERRREPDALPDERRFAFKTHVSVVG